MNDRVITIAPNVVQLEGISLKVVTKDTIFEVNEFAENLNGNGNEVYLMIIQL